MPDDQTSIIPELSVVALTRPRQCEDGTLPEGTTGAVVFVYDDGQGYEIEFDEPFHCVVTVERADIRLV